MKFLKNTPQHSCTPTEFTKSGNLNELVRSMFTKCFILTKIPVLNIPSYCNPSQELIHLGKKQNLVLN